MMGEFTRKAKACLPPGVTQHDESLNICSSKKEPFSRATWRLSNHKPLSIYVIIKESERKGKKDKKNLLPALQTSVVS